MPENLTGTTPKNMLLARIPLAELLLAMTFILTLMGYWSFIGWPADLASHFKAQYAAIQLACLVWVLVRRKPVWVLIAVLGLIPNLVELSQWYSAPERAIGTSAPMASRIRLMQLNVKLDSTSYHSVMEVIRAEKPDILSLQEVDDEWLSRLNPVLKNYPHHVESVKAKRHYGLALYSKIPFERVKVHEFGGVKRPNLLAALSLDDNLVTIVAAHPMSPGNPERYIKRDRQLFGIADARMDLGQYLIVIGDLNATDYSDVLKLFKNDTGLRSANAGFGLQPTWPSFFPPLWIPIDHVLVSEGFDVLSYHTGAFTGSDHLPLVVELALKPAPMQSLPGSMPDGEIPLDGPNPAKPELILENGAAATIKTGKDSQEKP